VFVFRQAATALVVLCSISQIGSAKLPEESSNAKAIRIVELTDYYDIGGRSVTALWNDIRARGPRTGETPWAGHARWDVRWTYDWRRSSSGCSLERAATSLTITYTLPRWPGRNEADETLRDKWDRFALNLKVHEEGHGANGRRAAERIQAALVALPPQTDCDVLAQKVEQTARLLIDEEAANDRAYDSSTQHGLRQGVVLR
jgi:predicted secreted Zn-dependent protease